MAMEDEIIINSIDVTDYRRTWINDENWGVAIGAAIVELSNSVKDILTPAVGQVITIKRGETTPTDEFVFEGQITQIAPEATGIKLICKGTMIEAVKAGRTKSWDMNIDTEAGVGSEIFKDICDNSGLSYDSTTIPSTGTDDGDKIVKFIQNDEDDFDRMTELALRYNRSITYDYSTAKVSFLPKGYTTYGTSLTVGTEIPGQIEWIEDMEQLCNKVKINGATVYDKVVETFAGPASEFTLSKTPEDTEVRINHATTDNLQTRGQKDLGVLGTDFDYYVDVEQKKIVFNSNVSDLWINYGAQVPMPVVVQNSTSIATYGGPNQTPHYKKFTFNDLKDIKDAEQRGNDILSKYSLPFNEAEDVPVHDETRQTYGNLTPGMIVNIIDEYNDKDLNVFVYGVKKSWPHVHDTISVGDEIWRTETWQTDQMKKINLLFNELNKNQDILVTVQTFARQKRAERRYAYKEKLALAAPVFILGHPIYSKVGTQAQGGTQIGDTSDGSSWIIQELVQGQKTLGEYLYDTLFIDTVNTTATVNTTTKSVSFTDGQILYSDETTKGHNIESVKITVYFTGTLTCQVTADGDSGTPTWDTVTLTSGVETNHTFTVPGDVVMYKFTASGVCTISTQINAYDELTAPGIKMIMTYV